MATWGAGLGISCDTDITIPNNDIIYIGTDIGLAFSVLATTGQIAEISFFSGFSVSAIHIDTNTKSVFYVLFGMTNNMLQIARVDPGTNGQVADSFSMTISDAFASSDYDPVTRTLFVILQNGTLFRFNVANCAIGMFNSCTTCLTSDPLYCIWCLGMKSLHYFTVSLILAHLNLETGTCLNSCTNPLSESNNCPTISSFSPSAVGDAGGVNVTLTLSQPVASSGLTCLIGGLITTTFILGPNTVVCLTNSATGPQTISIQHSNGNLFAASTQSLEFISCDSVNCQECTSGARLNICSWCPSSVMCQTTGQFCSVTPLTSFTTCPVFNSLTPRNSAQGATSLLTASSNRFSNAMGQTFSFSLVGPENRSFDATSMMLSQISAPLPSDLMLGTYNVTVILNNTDYFQQAMPITIFDCASNTNCSTCTDPNINCVWCREDLVCAGAAALCPSSQTTQQCPIIAAFSPPSSFSSGINDILQVFTSGQLPTTGNYSCVFGMTSVDAMPSPNQAGVFDCSSVPPGPVGQVSFQLLNSINTSRPVAIRNFLYFDCNNFDDCESCTDVELGGACTYCFDNGGSCQDSAGSTCEGPQFNASCPEINQISPSGIEVDQVELINVSLSILPSNLAYNCVWLREGSVIETTTASASGNTLSCMSPAGDPSLIDDISSFYRVDLLIQSNNSLMQPNNTPPQIQNVSRADEGLTFFTCPAGDLDCPSCSALPFCGFCLDLNRCTSDQTCENVWLTNETGCPSITSITPDHAALEGGNNITVQGNLFLLADLSCSFGELGTTPAIRTSDTQVICVTAPAQSNALTKRQASSTNLTLIRSNGGNFAQNSVEIFFVDCSVHDDCQSCTEDTENGGRCGWCLNSVTCEPSFNCDQQEQDWQSDECPTITSIDPTSGELEEETQFTLIGTLFRPGLQVMFDDVLATDVSVDSETQISGTTPAVSILGASTVTITLENRLYASETLSFNIIPQTSSAANIPAIVGATLGVSCCFILCGIAIFYVFYSKWASKLNRRTVQVVEPKWDIISFNNWLSPLWKGKTLKDYEEFIKILVNPNSYGLLHGIEAITQSTEKDNLARSLVYLFENQSLASELIVRFIDIEVETAIEESAVDTIFRANSIVTRMFKYYAKLVGTRYLFNTLARYVAEMELSRRLQLEDEEELNTIRDMELDPNKMAPDDDELQIQENKSNLLSFSQKILNTILRSTDKIPPQILKCIQHVKNKVDSTLNNPAITFKSIGAFFFLRFICPAVAAPESYFREDPPDPYIRRQLILLSKILQNLANDVQFGGKEQFMAPLNPFITDNADNIKKFYAKITSAALGAESNTDIPPEVVLNSCAWVHDHSSTFLGDIKTELSNSKKYPDCQTQFEKFAFELGNLENPPTKIKKH